MAFKPETFKACESQNTDSSDKWKLFILLVKGGIHEAEDLQEFKILHNVL